MNLVFSGIEIDLLFATINEPSVPEDIDLSNLTLLRHMDLQGVRSLNGPRVAEELLKLVPNPETYRRALCCIKLWAQSAFNVFFSSSFPDFILTSVPFTNRAGNLREHPWLPRRHFLGSPHRPHLPILPKRLLLHHCFTLFQDLQGLELAPASNTEAE